jgi:hypothetical protein
MIEADKDLEEAVIVPVGCKTFAFHTDPESSVFL